MKFRSNMSITKLVFLIIILCLCTFTWYYVFSNKEDSTWVIVAFLSVAMQITNYYFKDKKEKDYPDALIKKEEKTVL
jgi:uncharacterized protein (DUF486 family)